MIKLIETDEFYLIQFEEKKSPYTNTLFYKSEIGFYLLYNTTFEKIQKIGKFIQNHVSRDGTKLYIQKYLLHNFKKILDDNRVNYKIYHNSYNFYDKCNSTYKRIIKFKWN